ncbi:MAG: hypothetical protein ACTSRR_00170 [Candidatus Heimdallarchaeaceae archaeon]
MKLKSNPINKQLLIVLMITIIIGQFSFLDIQNSTLLNALTESDSISSVFTKTSLPKAQIVYSETNEPLIQTSSSNSSITYLKNSITVDENINVDYNKTISNFAPKIELNGRYKSDLNYLNLSDKEIGITLPEKGDFFLVGNVSDLKANIIQNSGAETAESFYANDSVLTGIELQRYLTSNGLSGNYSWKIYANNTTSLKYSTYMKDLSLFSRNIILSYDYKFDSNSSIQNVINSSVIFDFTFDTCRVAIYNWVYSNVGLEQVGQNDTSGDYDTFKFVRNTTWDDNWNSLSLNLSAILSEFSSNIPSQLEGFSIFVISPEQSESSFFFDNLKIESQPIPEEIELKLNGSLVNSIDDLKGSFSIQVHVEEKTDVNLIFSLNSSYTVEGQFSLQAIGNISLFSKRQLLLVPPDEILFNVSIDNIVTGVFGVVIGIPLNWSLVEYNSQYVTLISVNEFEDFDQYELLICNTSSLVTIFAIQNNVKSIVLTSSILFETLNVEFNLTFNSLSIKTNFFWIGPVSGGVILDIQNNRLEYRFPSIIPRGEYSIIFLNLNSTIFYYSCNISLTRYAADIAIVDSLTLPQYGSTSVNLSYHSLGNNISIENSSIYVFLDDTKVYSFTNITEVDFIVSMYYLSLGNHTVKIMAFSTFHASVVKIISLISYESPLNVVLDYFSLNDKYYSINLNVSCDGFPVAFAPLKFYIGNISGSCGALSGITDEMGYFQNKILVPLNILSINVTLHIMRYSSIIKIKTFTIINQILKVDVDKTDDELLLGNNVTFSYWIKYSAQNDRWFLPMVDGIPPVLNAYIDTGLFMIPVTWDNTSFYWQVKANSSTYSHKFVIICKGPQLNVKSYVTNNEIQFQLKIYASYLYKNASILLYSNINTSLSSYDWKITNSNGLEITDTYKIVISYSYVKISGLELAEGTYLLLNLIGINNSFNNTVIFIPLAIGSLTISAISFIGIKFYKKRKSLSIEL